MSKDWSEAWDKYHVQYLNSHDEWRSVCFFPTVTEASAEAEKMASADNINPERVRVRFIPTPRF